MHIASPFINMHIAASKIRQNLSEFGHISSIVCKFIVNILANSFFGRWPSFLISLVESFELVPQTPPMA